MESVATETGSVSLGLVIQGKKDEAESALSHLTLDEAVELALASQTLASLARHRAFLLRGGGYGG
jgi:hypothetical protein